MSNSSSNIRRRPALWPLFALALAGGVIVLYLTANGIGIWPDSVHYLSTARGLASGRPPLDDGLSDLAHFPPLLPLMLAGLERLGIDSLVGARILNTTFIVATVLLVGLLVRRATGRAGAAVIAAAFVLANENVLQIHTAIASEPAFYFFTLSCLYFLVRHLQSPRMTTLVACAGFASLAMLTRYAGAAIGVGAAAAVFLFSRQSFARRSRDSILLGAIAFCASVAFAVHNHFSGGSATGRALVYHSPDAVQLRIASQTLTRWFIPEYIPVHHRLLLVSLMVAPLIVLLVVAWKRQRKARRNSDAVAKSSPRLLEMLLVFIALYSALLLATILYFDASMEFNPRILSPLYMMLVLLGAIMVMKLLPARGLLRGGIVGVIILGLTVRVVSAGVFVANHRDVSKGYATDPWKSSTFFSHLRNLPPNVMVISNDPTAIRFLADRASRKLPQKCDSLTMKPSIDYARELAQLRDDLQAGRAIIVYFGIWDQRDFQPTADELQTQLGLQKVYESADDIKAMVLTDPLQPIFH